MKKLHQETGCHAEDGLPFRPLALRNRLSPIVPLSVQPALQRVAQMIVFSLEPFWTVQRRFSFQIKTPLTARTALQGGYKVSLAAGCQRYFVPSLQSRARCKGGFYLEAESSLYCPKRFQGKHNHLCYSLKSRLYRQGHDR